MKINNSISDERDNEDRLISLEALEYLGYLTSDSGMAVKYKGYFGEIIQVWQMDNCEDASFCCFYIPKKEMAFIIPTPFEEAVDLLRNKKIG